MMIEWVMFMNGLVTGILFAVMLIGEERENKIRIDTESQPWTFKHGEWMYIIKTDGKLYVNGVLVTKSKKGN